MYKHCMGIRVDDATNETVIVRNSSILFHPLEICEEKNYSGTCFREDLSKPFYIDLDFP
jgi:hypothetical protein